MFSQSPLALTLAAGTRVCRLDAELMVLNPSSWETHLLNAEAALVVSQLVRGPRSLTELQHDYRAAHPGEPTEACDSAVESLVEELIDLGVVSPDAGSAADAAR